MTLGKLTVGDFLTLHGIMRQPDIDVFYGDVSKDGSYALLWKSAKAYLDGKPWDIMAAMSSPATLIGKLAA